MFRLKMRFAPGLIGGALVALLLGAGCQTVAKDWDLPGGPSFVPSNFYQAGPLPKNIRRVGVLPFYSADWKEVDFAPMEAIFRGELGKLNRFEVVEISPELLRQKFGRSRFSSVDELPHDFLSVLAELKGIDGLIFVDLTRYSPYQPVALGVRSKLVDITDARVLWSFDTVFDSSEPSVETAARRYQRSSDTRDYPLNSSASVLQSPLRFSKYVANAVFRTLPEH